MKKVIQLCLLAVIGLNLNAQTWVNFDFTVPMDKAETFNTNWEEFMNSETIVPEFKNCETVPRRFAKFSNFH